jgi:hypothetical protein
VTDGAETTRPAWVYESIVEAVPGVRLSTPVALGVQFLGFEVLVLALGVAYGLPTGAILAGTVAVVVATVGSAAMTTIAGAVRGADAPAAYRRLLLGSRIELVLGLLAYVALLTYLFVVDPRQPPVLLDGLLGGRLPVPVVYVMLLLLWDLTYRIGAAWWASVAALWRSWRWAIDGETATRLRRADLVTLGFGVLQLALVPFVLDQPPLVAVLLGHVAAVVVVVTGALALGRRERISPSGSP